MIRDTTITGRLRCRQKEIYDTRKDTDVVLQTHELQPMCSFYRKEDSDMRKIIVLFLGFSLLFLCSCFDKSAAYTLAERKENVEEKTDAEIETDSE